jgi:hypothetical protein
LNISSPGGVFLSQNSLKFLVPRAMHHGKSLFGGYHCVSYTFIRAIVLIQPGIQNDSVTAGLEKEDAAKKTEGVVNEHPIKVKRQFLWIKKR